MDSSLLAMPIIKTDLSIRCHNVLKNYGINTVGDLVKYERDKLSKMRNLGAKSISEIVAFLESLDSGTIGIVFDSTNYAESNIFSPPPATFRDSLGVESVYVN